MEHPAILEAAVVGRQDADGLVKSCAFVVLKNGYAASEELKARLRGHVRARLAGYKAPHWVEFAPELPKTPTGKLQRFRLRQQQLDP